MLYFATPWITYACRNFKLSVYGDESLVMTEWVISPVQDAEMGYLCRVHGVTFHNQVAAVISYGSECQITSLIRETSARLVWWCNQIVPGKIGVAGPAGYIHMNVA